MKSLFACLLACSVAVSTLFESSAMAAPTTELLHSFVATGPSDPTSALLLGSDGNFYGTTDEGGASGLGTIFKMTPAGTLSTLVEFTGNGATNKGASPNALVRGSDGNFYGTTRAGGAGNNGTVFKMTPAGTLTTLVEFTVDGPSNRGASPRAALVQGTDGNFYGTTDSGGASIFCGTIFKITPTGTLTTLVEFTNDGAANRGCSPQAALVLGSDGNFYGTTSTGAGGFGTVFKMTPAGTLATLVEFTGNGAVNKGDSPQAALVQGSDGNFYGTTNQGGQGDYGTVFKVTAAGTLTTLIEFTYDGASNKGAYPEAPLIQGSDGNFYGTASSGGRNGRGTVFKVTSAGAMTILVELTANGPAKGGHAPSSLLQSSDGNFYGTTSEGGADSFGTVFKLSPAGVLTILLEFTGNGAVNKGRRATSLVEGIDGNFYGTTTEGGANDMGTVFKMTPAGALTTLVQFTGNGATSRGSRPAVALAQGSDGNFYGATAEGGAGNFGTLFRMTPTGTLTTLVEFTGNGTANRGRYPEVALVQGIDNNYYGATSDGGTSGYGTLFKITPAGVLTTLVDFTNDVASNTGNSPNSLLRGSDGNFYGTTHSGGATNDGAAFRMSPAGALITLAQFSLDTGANHGEQPGNLVQGSDGNFYGTTGDFDQMLFRMTPAGVVTKLAQFNFNTPDSGYEASAMIQSGDGNLYGATFAGGASFGGTIFRFSLAQGPIPPETAITSGPSGTVNSGDATFTFVSNVTGATFEASLDGGTWVAATSPHSYAGLSQGSHTFQVRATGPGGTDQTPARRTWTVNNPPPSGTLTVTIQPAGAVSAGAQWQVDSGAPQASGATMSGLSPGSHFISFLAISGWTKPQSHFVAVVANQTTSDAGTYVVIPPPPVPDTSITSGPSGKVNSKKATFTFISNVAGATFEASRDDQAWVAVTSPHTYTGLGDGPHTFKVRASGPGGTDATPASQMWKVDTIPPETTILSGPPNPSGGTAMFTFASSKPNSTFKALLDGVAVKGVGGSENVTSPVILYSLSVAQHTFSVRAIDNGGLEDATPATQIWNVMNGRPGSGSRRTNFSTGASLPGSGGVPALRAGAALAGMGASEAGSVAAAPADAVLKRLSTPAIDEDGNVFLNAKWTSATGGKGKGIFNAFGSVAEVGDSVPGVDGATFAALGTPVVDSGYVAFLATLAGVPAAKIAAVLSDAPTGTLAVVARAGDVAPGAEGAKFKSFESVAVAGSCVAFLGKLKIGSGSPAVTEANDLGVWAMDASHSLTLLLREGQKVNGKKIKTLAAFVGGNGSPGQGRGWLRVIGSEAPQVLALALMGGKTQAVLSVDLDGVVTALSQSGPNSVGGPDIDGANFASYGVPAANAQGYSAFRASLAAGAGGVTESDASGIFLRNPTDTLYTPVTRTGDPFGTTGAKVSVVKDPVLASDGGLAFPVIVKGGGVRGLAKRLLCWQPPGKPLALLAQGGAEPAGVPGAQWESFTSLAIIPERGPLFAATLVVGAGGVTADNARGVWAMDSTGQLQLLFRTGEVIDGKTVQSFQVLEAVPGSVGVTRNFNDRGEVLWLATFTDKTQTIVATAVE